MGAARPAGCRAVADASHQGPPHSAGHAWHTSWLPSMQQLPPPHKRGTPPRPSLDSAAQLLPAPPQLHQGHTPADAARHKQTHPPGLKGLSYSTSLRLCPVASTTRLPATWLPPSSATVERPLPCVTSLACSRRGGGQSRRSSFVPHALHAWRPTCARQSLAVVLCA